MLVVAEKPSVAKDIRFAVRPAPYVVALRGHFMELDFPKEYNYWRGVDPKELSRALRDGGMVVIATNNDSEGELIGYEVLLAAEKVLGWEPQYRRMRSNVAAPQELRRTWLSLEPRCVGAGFGRRFSGTGSPCRLGPHSSQKL